VVTEAQDGRPDLRISANEVLGAEGVSGVGIRREGTDAPRDHTHENH
jgi:hypothetical protein